MPEKIGDYYIDFTVNDGKGKQQLNQLDEQMSKTAKKQEGMFNVLKSGWATVVTGINQAVQLFSQIGQAFGQLATDAAKFEQASSAMWEQFGVRANDAITALRKASGGTVKDAALVQAANRAMALGVTKDFGEMAKLMEYARLRARAMGTDTTQAFDDIVTGIGRGSPQILDNLGIITKGWAEEAQASGKAYDAQFILNKVLQQAGQELGKTGKMALTSAERLQRMQAKVANIRDAFGGLLNKVLVKISPVVDVILGRFEDLLGIGDEVSRTIKEFNDLFADAKTPDDYADAIKRVGDEIETMGEKTQRALLNSLEMKEFQLRFDLEEERHYTLTQNEKKIDAPYHDYIVEYINNGYDAMKALAEKQLGANTYYYKLLMRYFPDTQPSKDMNAILRKMSPIIQLEKQLNDTRVQIKEVRAKIAENLNAETADTKAGLEDAGDAADKAKQKIEALQKALEYQKMLQEQAQMRGDDYAEAQSVAEQASIYRQLIALTNDKNEKLKLSLELEKLLSAEIGVAKEKTEESNDLLDAIDAHIAGLDKKNQRLSASAQEVADTFREIAGVVTADLPGAFAGVADSVVELGAAIATGNWLGAITAAVGLLKKAVNYTKEVKKEMREAFASQYRSWQGRAIRARDLGYDAVSGKTYTNEDYLSALKGQAKWAKEGVFKGTVLVEDYYDILLEIRSVEEDITAEKKEQLKAIEDARDEAKQAYLDEISRRAGLGAIDTENWAQASKIIASMGSAGLSNSELVDALNSLGYKTSNLGIAASGAVGKTVEINGNIITNVYQATVNSALQQIAAAVKNAISE